MTDNYSPVLVFETSEQQYFMKNCCLELNSILIFLKITDNTITIDIRYGVQPRYHQCFINLNFFWKLLAFKHSS